VRAFPSPRAGQKHTKVKVCFFAHHSDRRNERVLLALAACRGGMKRFISMSGPVTV
jgi:hypothetical protein